MMVSVSFLHVTLGKAPVPLGVLQQQYAVKIHQDEAAGGFHLAVNTASHGPTERESDENVPSGLLAKPPLGRTR